MQDINKKSLELKEIRRIIGKWEDVADPTAEAEAERQKEKEEAQRQALARIECEVARKRREAEKEAKTAAKEAEKAEKEAEKAEKAAREREKKAAREREKKAAQQLAQKEAKAKAKAPKAKGVRAELSEKPLKPASKPTAISPVACTLCQASSLECRVLTSGPRRSCQLCTERKKKCSLVSPPTVSSSHDLSNTLLEKAQHRALERILHGAQQAGTLEARDNAGQSADMDASDIGKSLNLISL